MLVSVDRAQQFVGLGEVFKDLIGSRVGEFGHGIASAGNGNDPCPTVSSCSHVVWRVADQDRRCSVEPAAVGCLGVLAGDLDKVGAGLVVGTLGAAVEVDVMAQSEYLELDFCC